MKSDAITSIDAIKPIYVRLLKIRLWLSELLRPKEFEFILVLAGIVGFVGALINSLFYAAVHLLQWLFIQDSEGLVHAALRLPWWERLLVPTLGGAAAGLVLYFGSRLARGRNATDFLEAISIGNGVLHFRSSIAKSVSSLFSIASGGAIGREGPMVTLASYFSSWLGQRLDLSPPRLRLLVACGAAAGIASAYKAPIAGSIFVAEIVLGSIAMESFGPLVLAAVVATLTIQQTRGSDPVFAVPALENLGPIEVAPVAILGLIAGASAPRFLGLLRKSEGFFASLRVPVFVRLALGGFGLGLLSLISPEVWGNGHSTVNSMLHNEWHWLALLLVLVCKVAAVSMTVGSGAVGGLFTPILFVGAVFGVLYHQGLHAIMPSADGSAHMYAVIGMGCFLAACTHAPLMAMIMLFELTLDYAVVLPVMFACVIAYYTSVRIDKRSVYSESLRRKRPPVPSLPIAEMKVRDLMKASPVCVDEKASFAEIAQVFALHRHNYLYVVNVDSHMVGTISLQGIKEHLSDPLLAKLVTAYDVMNERTSFLFPEMNLGEAVHQFLQHDGERLPVVSNDIDRVLLGSVSKTDLLLTFGQKMHPAGAATEAA